MPWQKQFDRDEVLDRAKETFWSSGYEGVSMDVLLSRMGIQKGSFYATYGSKHDVLLESLQRYIGERFSSFDSLSRSQPPLEALAMHLREVFDESTGRQPDRGCFLVNAATELAPSDPAVQGLVRRALKAHRDFYRRLLASARETHELPTDFDIEATADGLLAIVLGMRVMARAGIPKAVLESSYRQALRLIRP